MDETYREQMERVMASDPSCAYELEPFPLPEQMHETRQMYVLRGRDGVVGYFARKEDAEQRMLVDESVDAERAWVTVR